MIPYRAVYPGKWLSIERKKNTLVSASISFLLKKVKFKISRHRFRRKKKRVMDSTSLFRWLDLRRLFQWRMDWKKDWWRWQPQKTHWKRTSTNWKWIWVWAHWGLELQVRHWIVFYPLEKGQKNWKIEENLHLFWCWRSQKVCCSRWESLLRTNLCW